MAARAAAPTHEAPGRLEAGQVREMFDRIAPRYDLLNRLMTAGLDGGWRRAAAAAADLSAGGRALDCCTGTGDLALELAARVTRLGEVVGVDFAESMLARARAKAAARGVGHVRFATADVLGLPFEDGSFDAATVAFGIRNVADLDAGLREMHRVLAPSARFVILEFTTPRSSIVRGLYHLYFHRILPQIGAMVSGHRTAYAYLPRSVASFPIEEKLADRMRSAGFVDVNWRTLTFGVAAIHTGTKP
jgi:demethylmenaquinone methyltransferase / 2-methoxy-6-polyprenyl-1,4-benzoquinol methylase